MEYSVEGETELQSLQLKLFVSCGQTRKQIMTIAELIFSEITHTHARTHTHVHAYLHTHTHTHTHTYTY